MVFDGCGSEQKLQNKKWAHQQKNKLTNKIIK